MFAIGTFIRRTFAPILVTLLLIGVAKPAATYTVKDPDTCITNFTVVSDIHMEGNNKASRDAFAKELYDIKNNKSGNDAFVMLGDNTMNGQHIENMFLYGYLSQIPPADRVFATLGNHDTGNGIGEYDKLIKRFYTYYNDFCGMDISTPYYEAEVNGYSFIFLGSEADDSNFPIVTDKQFSWLNERLAAATADGKPAFVYGHHPYYCYEESDKLLDILTSYKNVFFFTGHYHTEYVHIAKLADSVYQFILPRVTELNDEGKTFEITGQGVNVEVYEDTVLVRERNFFTSEWMTEHTFPIVK